MLEPKEKSEEDRHAVMKPEEGGRTACLLHERKIGLEEEGIIISSNQTVSASCQSLELFTLDSISSYLVVKAFPKRLHFSANPRFGP